MRVPPINNPPYKYFDDNTPVSTNYEIIDIRKYYQIYSDLNLYTV